MCNKKVLVFAGTTEGREIINFLEENEIPSQSFVATEYGKEIIGSKKYVEIFAERLDNIQMENIIAKNNYDFVIDATHPFAAVVTNNIKLACSKTNSCYLRIVRNQPDLKGAVFVPDFEQAVNEINKYNANVLITTGSKDIEKLVKINDFTDRVYARVLPSSESIEKCKAVGLKGANIICMQGPFSAELNYAMLKQLNCKLMLTKASGNIGGVNEKLEAVKKMDGILIVINPPSEEKGLTVNEIKERLLSRYE